MQAQLGLPAGKAAGKAKESSARHGPSLAELHGMATLRDTDE